MNKTLRNVFTLISMTGFALSANAGMFVWKTYPAESNTPATALDWTDAANWEGGEVPGAYDGVKFNKANSFFYVKVPVNTVVSNLNIHTDSGKYACIVCERLILSAKPQYTTRAMSSFGAGLFYGDIESSSETDSTFPYLAGLQLAGRAIARYQNWVPSSGWVEHRLDKFAYSSSPVRTDDIQIADNKAYNPGNANISVYAPHGADACTGRWNLTKDSPYITLAAEKHAIVPGAVVTGEGIPENTFVKRIFSESYVELSAPATADASAAELSFSALTPDVRIKVNTFSRMGDGDRWFSLYKYRPEDGLRYEISTINGYAPQIQYIGVSKANAEKYLPGTHVFHKIGTNGGRWILNNSHLELAGDGTKPTTFVSSLNVEVAESCTARITVTNNISAVVNTFTNFAGTIVKDGAGSLALHFAETANKGSISLEGGVLTIAKKDSAAAGPVALESLELGEDAILEIPEEGLLVSRLRANEGAKVRGPGLLTAIEVAPDSQKMVFENGATFIHSPGVTGAVTPALPEGTVAGHPVFWLDASMPETIVCTENENGEKLVTRWNDCREGEPMFCTNIFYSPVFVNGETMAEKYVNIRRRMTSTNALTEALVWSVPVKDIKAVFLVQDPVDGGGEILGRTARLDDSYYGTQGGPYYRGKSHDRTAPVISPNYATPNVKFGRFYIDGVPICGYEQGYAKTGLQVIEHHVAEDQYANSNNKRKELWIDAFGVGYQDRNTHGMGCNGCMRIAEYIIYTNALTHAERLQTARYLSRKWTGKDIYWEVAEEIGNSFVSEIKPFGQTVNIDEGKSYAIMSVGGPGAIRKTGEGTLFLGNVTNASVAVAGGELIVRSLCPTNSIVPSGAWVHVDATEKDSIDFVESNGIKCVAKWKSLTDGLCGYTPYEHLPKYPAHAPAMYRENAINSLPAIDLGPINHPGDRSSPKRAMRFVKADGTRYEKINASPYVKTPEFRSIFIVADSSQGGNSLLGSDMDGYPAVGFPHKFSPDFSTPIISCEDYNWGYTSFSNYYENGKATFRTNGIPVNGNVAPFSLGADVFVWHCAVYGPRSDSLGIHNYESVMNGLMYGEVLLYENVLTDTQMLVVEAYLRKKWKGESTPGIEVARLESLFLENGASVRMCGYGYSETDPAGPLLTGSIGGCGTFAGDVVLDAEGELVVDIAPDGTPRIVTVNGKADFSQGGTVSFKGDVSNIAIGRLPVLAATALDFGGEWICESPVKSHTFSVCAIGNTVYLNANKSATILILR